MIKSYKDLEVWKKSIELVKKIYKVTRDFPKEEMYGLVNQLRRSSISIPSNIAEGKNRQYTKEYVQFLYVALGSCSELETQVIISQELGYFNEKVGSELGEGVIEISRMIRGLINSLK